MAGLEVYEFTTINYKELEIIEFQRKLLNPDEYRRSSLEECHRFSFDSV